MKRLLSSLVLAAVTALALTSCGDSSTEQASTSESAAYNQADVLFAKEMVPHHRQAVTMSDMAATRSSSPLVRALAVAIEAAQAPEIKVLTGWLQEWGEDVSLDSMSGMDHGSGGMGSDEMPGMMSKHEMNEMSGTDGAAFDQLRLRNMVAHHEGAVELRDYPQGVSWTA